MFRMPTGILPATSGATPRLAQLCHPHGSSYSRATPSEASRVTARRFSVNAEEGGRAGDVRRPAFATMTDDSALHLNEGSERCPDCGHPEREHEVTQVLDQIRRQCMSAGCFRYEQTQTPPNQLT